MTPTTREETSKEAEHKPVSEEMLDQVDFEDEGSEKKHEEEKEELLELDPYADERRASEESFNVTREEQWDGRLKAKKKELTSTGRHFKDKGRILIYNSKDNILEDINCEIIIDKRQFKCRHWVPLRLKRNSDYRDYRTQPQSFEDDMREILRLEREGKLYDADQYHLVDINNFGHALAQRCRNLVLGHEEHIRFSTGPHMMSIIIKHKVDKETGKYKGIALEFYDPNLTFKHMRVLAPDADALEEFELLDWLDTDSINKYFPFRHENTIGIFLVDVKSSETIDAKILGTITEKVIIDDSLAFEDVLFNITVGPHLKAIFMALIDWADIEKLNQALAKKSEYGGTVLHLAARFQKGAPFIALVDKVGVKVLSDGLMVQDMHGETVLQTAMHYQSKEAIMALVRKVNVEKLSHALTIPRHCFPNHTALHAAARWQPKDVIEALINKVSEAALISALVLLAKDTTPKFTFELYVNIVDVAALNRVLVLLGDDHPRHEIIQQAIDTKQNANKERDANKVRKRVYFFMEKRLPLHMIAEISALAADSISKYHTYKEAVIIAQAAAVEYVETHMQQMVHGELLENAPSPRTSEEEEVKSPDTRHSVFSRSIVSPQRPPINIQGLTYEVANGEGGHCFYRSIGAQVGHSFQELRDMVAREVREDLQRDPAVMDFILLSDPENPDLSIPSEERFETVEEYITGVTNNKWADHLEMTILAKLFRRPIYIIQANTEGEISSTTIISQDHFLGRDPIFVYYNGENHYDILRKDRGVEYADILRELGLEVTAGESIGSSPSPNPEGFGL